jgi:hypothetical protein
VPNPAPAKFANAINPMIDFPGLAQKSAGADLAEY